MQWKPSCAIASGPVCDIISTVEQRLDALDIPIETGKMKCSDTLGGNIPARTPVANADILLPLMHISPFVQEAFHPPVTTPGDDPPENSVEQLWCITIALGDNSIARRSTPIKQQMHQLLTTCDAFAEVVIITTLMTNTLNLTTQASQRRRSQYRTLTVTIPVINSPKRRFAV